MNRFATVAVCLGFNSDSKAFVGSREPRDFVSLTTIPRLRVPACLNTYIGSCNNSLATTINFITFLRSYRYYANHFENAKSR